MLPGTVPCSAGQLLSDAYALINTSEINTLSSLYKLLLSMFLGACVGFERKRKGQTAGVRTFSLISMGACLAMILSIYVPQEYLGLKNGDPGRIAAQVVTGIGFLGAGAIIQMKGSVRGLTTAAGIWMVAAIGMAVGAGMYLLSALATLLILIVLVNLEKIEQRHHVGNDMRIIRLSLKVIVEKVQPYRKALEKEGVILSNYYVQYDYAAGTTHLNLVVLVPESTDMLGLMHAISKVYPTESMSLATQLGL